MIIMVIKFYRLQVRLKIHTKHPLGAPPLRAFVKREPKAAYKLYQEHPDEYTVEDIPIPDVRLANEGMCIEVNHLSIWKYQ